MNNKEVDGLKINVAPFKLKTPMQTADAFTNLYVKSLPVDFSREKLTALFSKFGTITSTMLRFLPSETPAHAYGFGFVNFEVFAFFAFFLSFFPKKNKINAEARGGPGGDQ